MSSSSMNSISNNNQMTGIYHPSVLNALKEATTKEYYENPQTVDCQQKHTFSLNTVFEKFGALKENQCAQPGLCPLCGTRVSTYWPNTALQMVASAIYAQVLKKVNLEQLTEIKEKEGVAYPFEKFNCNFKKITISFVTNQYTINSALEVDNELRHIEFIFDKKQKYLAGIFYFESKICTKQFADFMENQGLSFKHLCEDQIQLETKQFETARHLLNVLKNEVFSSKTSLFGEFQTLIKDVEGFNQNDSPNK